MIASLATVIVCTAAALIVLLYALCRVAGDYIRSVQMRRFINHYTATVMPLRRRA